MGGQVGCPTNSYGVDFLTLRTRKGCPTFSVCEKVGMDEIGFTILILNLLSKQEFKTYCIDPLFPPFYKTKKMGHPDSSSVYKNQNQTVYVEHSAFEFDV